MKKLEDRLYELRKENKLTQEDLASALDVSRQTISNWETGSAKPSISKAVDLAKLYGISLDSLVGNINDCTNRLSRVLGKYIGSKGTLYLQSNVNQPFFPESCVKNVEIIEIESSYIKVRVYKKEIVDQLVFIKDVLGFSKEV